MSFPGQFQLVGFLLTTCLIRLLFFNPNFLLDIKHCEFYLIGCWIFFFFLYVSSALFWGAAKLLRNHLMFLFVFQILLLSLFQLNQTRIFSTVNSASQIRQIPSWYFSQCPMNSEVFPIQLLKTRTISSLV